jgi:hypothetical protein
VDRAAPQCDPNHAAVDDQVRELSRVELHQARPQPDVGRRPGRLRLQAHQALQTVHRGHRHPFEQQLTSE